LNTGQQVECAPVVTPYTAAELLEYSFEEYAYAWSAAALQRAHKTLALLVSTAFDNNTIHSFPMCATLALCADFH
jgi:hypothetical protein